ncbi:unnamed protein product [Parnassius apollo]|uniref:(apollo) hypothetical protein n=1 Tax=Parnassius apollo TaxID=110799 RepID=A0A8S3XGA0_PARAO|nr:unnamed protein product [Parnassius apollo]
MAGTQEKYNWIETTIKVQLQHINKIKPDPRNVLSTSTIKLLEQRNQLINTKDINDRRKHIAKISKDINESIRKDSKRRRMEIIEKYVIKTGGVKKANKELTNSKDWIAKIKNLSGEYSHHRKNILQIATSYYRKIYEHNIAQDEDDLEETSNVPNILMSEVIKMTINYEWSIEKNADGHFQPEEESFTSEDPETDTQTQNLFDIVMQDRNLNS